MMRDGLPELFEADEVTIVGVAGVRRWARRTRTRRRRRRVRPCGRLAAHRIRAARGRSGRWQWPPAPEMTPTPRVRSQPDPVVRQQLFVLVDLRLEDVAERPAPCASHPAGCRAAARRSASSCRSAGRRSIPRTDRAPAPARETRRGTPSSRRCPSRACRARGSGLRSAAAPRGSSGCNARAAARRPTSASRRSRRSRGCWWPPTT